MVKKITLNETQFSNIVSKIVHGILNEEKGNMTIEEFKKELHHEQYEYVRDYCINVLDDCGYDHDKFHKIVDGFAWDVSENLSKKALLILSKDDWNYPSNKLYTLKYEMDKFDIHNFNDLLKSNDPFPIFNTWFFHCFDLQYKIKQKFIEYLLEILSNSQR